MDHKLSIAVVAITAVAVWVGLSLTQSDTQATVVAPVVKTADASSQSTAAKVDNEAVIDPQPTKVATNKPIEPPNFDIRKVAKPVKAAVASEHSKYSKEQLNALIAAKESKLQGAIGDYNKVLNDPQAKRKLENEFKKQSEAYKKALLEKVKRGDL